MAEDIDKSSLSHASAKGRSLWPKVLTGVGLSIDGAVDVRSDKH